MYKKVVVALILSTTAAAFPQCAFGPPRAYTTANCQSSGCRGQYLLKELPSVGSTYAQVTQEIECCGVYYPQSLLNPCTVASIDTPAMQQLLDKIDGRRELAVASCAGNYLAIHHA